MQRSNQPTNPSLLNTSDLKKSIGLIDFNTSAALRLSTHSLCSYHPDRISQFFFTLIENNKTIKHDLYTHLSQQGFRRSGNAFYRPHCNHCLQCISSRVLVKDFKPSRRYRRVLNRNTEVSLTLKPATEANQEHYNLYQRYITARHSDGDMYPPSLHTFEKFLVDSPVHTMFMEFREPNGKLIAVAVTDKVNDGLSSIYTFYDPDPSYHSRSLGVFCILQQISAAKRLTLDYVYLGFWIPNVKKMSYKIDFTPIELLINNHWMIFETKPNSEEVLSLLNTQPARLFV